ncbi:MAG: FAD-binding oxidoreductase [Nitratireductor sp.]|nr:FAD-binding oxidoreductase [Nitratireductor sp.]
MVGLHCAWRLRESGLSVVVLEARRIGRQATGRSTAKVTSQHGLRYASLKRGFGEEKARAYADANQQAVEIIASVSRLIEADAALEPCDAFIYAVGEDEVNQLEEEAQAARELGLPAEIVPSAKMPLNADALLKFSGQYQFDPVAYLRGLATNLGNEVRIFEESRVTDVQPGEPCKLTVNNRTVTARNVLVATQRNGAGRHVHKCGRALPLVQDRPQERAELARCGRAPFQAGAAGTAGGRHGGTA